MILTSPIARGAQAVLVALVFLLPLIGLLVPLGLAPLFTAAAVCSLVALITAGSGYRVALAGVKDGMGRLAIGALVAATALSLLSTLWAIDPATSFGRAIRLVVEVASGLVVFAWLAQLDDRRRDHVLLALAAGVLIAVLLALADRMAGFRLMASLHIREIGGTAYNRGLTTLAILMWPAAIHVGRRWHPIVGLILAGLVAYTVFGGDSDSGRLALLAGAGAWILGWLPRRLLQVGAMLVPLAILTMPVVPLVILANHPPGYVYKQSVAHRFLIWRFVGDRILEKPILGWGIEASRSMPGGKTKVQVPTPPGTVGIQEGEQLPLHPHNGALQLWLELGIPGALLGAALAFALVWRALGAAVPRTVRVTRLAALAASLSVLLLSYGIWQSWWVAALWLTAAMISCLDRRPAASGRPMARPGSPAPSDS